MVFSCAGGCDFDGGGMGRVRCGRELFTRGMHLPAQPRPHTTPARMEQRQRRAACAFPSAMRALFLIWTPGTDCAWKGTQAGAQHRRHRAVRRRVYLESVVHSQGRPRLQHEDVAAGGGLGLAALRVTPGQGWEAVGGVGRVMSKDRGEQWRQHRGRVVQGLW